jgi:hypothetical protein
MPRIKQVTVDVAAPVDLGFQERIENPSPDGNWNLVFHNPREFHMGAEGWQVRLLHHGKDVTSQHREFFSIAEPKGFRWERDFRPWSFDSKTLAMLTWENKPVHLYQVETMVQKTLDYEGVIMNSVQWAPDVDRLLLTFMTEGVLTDETGVEQSLVQWNIEEENTPNTFWMKRGRCFAFLGRQSGKSQLSFYAGVDGSLKETQDLDPIDIVPYNSEAYAEIPRGHFSLRVIDPPIGAVGSLLDNWNNAVFDQTSSTLFLSIFRPVSAPFGEGEQSLCDVKQVWVAVELDPD